MKFFLNLFAGRINRRNYLFGNLTLIGVFVISVFLLVPFSQNSSTFAVFLVASFYIFNLSLGVRRLHDLGRSAWSVCLLIVPGINLLLFVCLLLIILFQERDDMFIMSTLACQHVTQHNNISFSHGKSIRGVEGDNKFGPEPSKSIVYPHDILNIQLTGARI